MIELSLVTILNTMAPLFCDYKSQNMDTTKAVLLSFSKVHEKYKPKDIQKVIKDSSGFKEVAILVAATSCPLDAIK